ncbi:solute carrier family 2, facilitated glucose transporter member 8-like [Liolophura sinensis]|uniref:solute carrier family 2, facilitated glucose transporter member 8-like n=1 Tax=Liolophura sinensis TaxID=3198878 RepID=UPI0031582529
MMRMKGLVDDSQAAWFGSLMTVGAMFGGPLAGLLIEKYGRKRTMFLSSLPFAAGYVLILLADKGTLMYLFCGRLMTGLASGMVTVVVPVYIAEVSTKTLRGALGSGVQLSITIGILLAYSLGFALDLRPMACVGIICATLIAATSFFTPETPRYLLMRNQKAAALKSLHDLRGPHTDVQEECRDIEDALSPQEGVSWRDFSKAELYRPLQIAIGLMVFQQCSGINAIMFYTVSIFRSAGFKESGELATVLIGVVQVVATLLSLMVIERAGRRTLLLFGGALMTITCITFGWYYHAVSGVAESQLAAGNLAWLPIASLIIYMIGFSFGWGPIPMVLTSEIFPSQARGTACGISIFINWLCGFLVTKEFISLQAVLGPAMTFWLFAMFCFLSMVFVWRLVPETKGKSLEDIELYFLGRSLIRGV